MMNRCSSNVVALFVRQPVPGRVKTRLARALGREVACSFYRAMVADILSNIQGCGFSVYLFHDGTPGCELPIEWRELSCGAIAQRGASLGERMSAAFEHCFSADIEHLILTGSDIPGIDSRLLLSASAALDSHDAAIAPAADGGYGLIALKRGTYRHEIFQDISWSTAAVLGETLQRCAACCLRVCLLETIQDIDTIADLEAYCRNPSTAALATNRWLVAAGFMQP